MHSKSSFGPTEQPLTGSVIGERLKKINSISHKERGALAQGTTQFIPWGSNRPTVNHVPFHLLYSIGPSHCRLYSTKLPKRSDNLPHLTPSSEIHIISVSQKPVTHRTALAIGNVKFSNPRTLQLVQQNFLKKGDVLAVARIAGIRAIKNTAELIPLAHNSVGVEGAVVKVEPVSGSSNPIANSITDSPLHPELGNLDPANRRLTEAMQLTLPIGHCGGIRIAAQVETTAKTGVEMEALAGVMGAALTVVDMVKGVDREVSIESVKFVGKKGGRSGGWGVWADEV